MLLQSTEFNAMNEVEESTSTILTLLNLRMYPNTERIKT